MMTAKDEERNDAEIFEKSVDSLELYINKMVTVESITEVSIVCVAEIEIKVNTGKDHKEQSEKLAQKLRHAIYTFLLDGHDYQAEGA